MRASRLLTILMRLQKGRVTAEEIASLLEVSVRTVYRDMDQLSLAGVPVYADRGRAGGFQLLDGWKMPETGLSGLEVEALLLSGLPDQVRQLGLQASMLSGQDKILDSLSSSQQDFIGKISTCIYVDPVSWFGEEEEASHLKELAEAVWNRRVLNCEYESWRGLVSRILHPLGLVVKSGKWYLAASCDGDLRIYRVAKIHKMVQNGSSFSHPSDFDLATFWRQSVIRYEAEIYRNTAKLRLSGEGYNTLHKLGAPVVLAAKESRSGPDEQGRFTVRIPIESLSQACHDILQLGASCQVLEPMELIEEVRKELEKLKDLYGKPQRSLT